MFVSKIKYNKKILFRQEGGDISKSFNILI